MKTGNFPDTMKLGRVTPIFKKGNEEHLENYRPISTLPIFGKLFEKVIYSRLYSFMTSQNILHQNQFGFRASHSTSQALNYSVTKIEEAWKISKHVLGIFIDLSKAFDTIDHKTLLCKLSHYGIRGTAHSLLKSYLTNRVQYTTVLNEESHHNEIEFGVPQGSVLGPLLFIIYINDIVNCSGEAKFVLFADDTNIFITGNSELEAYEKANNVLKSVSTYMYLNKLHINKSKCCYIHFRPDNRTNKVHGPQTETELHLKIEGDKIKKVSETKFLGIIIDEKLSWDGQIKDLRRKLNYATASINRIKHSLPEHLHKDLYYTLFESHMSYCISVWGNIPKYKMANLFCTQKKCIRILFGDRDAYIEKFKTCVRCRPYDQQKLGKEFYEKEHTKPLFKKFEIMSVPNLYSYHCFLEVFKVLKFRTPIAMYSLFSCSYRKEMLLKLPPLPCSTSSYIFRVSKLWNEIQSRLKLSDFSVSYSATKTLLKKLIIDNQNSYDDLEWYDKNNELFSRSIN